MMATIHIYMDDGRVFEYDITGPSEMSLASKAREHAHAIVTTGYRHNNVDGEYEHYGPHRVLKVKVTGVDVGTMYPDKTRGT